MPGRYWQLVVFTVATQLAAGMVVMLAMWLHMASRGARRLNVDGAASVLLETVIATLVLAVAAAVMHLGSSRHAVRAATNLRESWLSREMATGVAFGLLVAGADIGYRFGLGSPAARRLCVVLAALTGLVLVYAMARLYMLRTVPAWNTPATPVSFFAATLLLGSAVTVGVVVVFGASNPALHDMLEEILPWLAWWCLVLVVVQLAATGGPVADVEAQDFAARRPMWILSALLGLGGAGILLVAVNLASSQPVSSPLIEIAIGVAATLLVASVVAGRCRFFASYERVGL